MEILCQYLRKNIYSFINLFIEQNLLTILRNTRKISVSCDERVEKIILAENYYVMSMKKILDC